MHSLILNLTQCIHLSLKIVDYGHVRPLHGCFGLVLALRRVKPAEVIICGIVDVVTATVDILWKEFSVIDLPGVSICGRRHTFRWCLNRARCLIENHLRRKVYLRERSLNSHVWRPTRIEVLKVLNLVLRWLIYGQTSGH